MNGLRTEPPHRERADVVVLGAGVAGTAAAVHLRRAGLRVVCVEPAAFPHDKVGESLDWSSPDLLEDLGLSRERLIAEEAATFKHGIAVMVPGYEPSISQPPDWWGAPPLRFEQITLHVDRLAMDRRLHALAAELGVEVVQDRAREVVVDGERVVAVETAGGRRLEATWFVDATGRGARLFARHFGIERRDYGREKVSLWCYFDTPCQVERTTIYVADARSDYLAWIWEIPITPSRTSVGVVIDADEVRRRRQHGRSTAEVLRDLLLPFPRFAPLLGNGGPQDVRATGYRCFVHENACGPNWLIAGEAALLVDALTGNGVTAGLRHAAEGAQLILEARERGFLTPRQRRVYNARVRRLGHMFNHAIETAVYEPPIRRGLGFAAAQVIYIMCAFILNALYTRLRPGKRRSMLAFDLLMRLGWVWIECWTVVGRLADAARGSRRALPAATARAAPRRPDPTVNGRSSLAYACTGSGPPVLFVHGYPTSRRLWDPVVADLASRFTCIAVDLPGLGESPPLEGRPDADVTAGELERLRLDLGFEAWSVVGHDAGAVAAVHYAASHPQRTTHLALLSPPIFPELRPPWVFRMLRRRLVGELAAPLALPLFWRALPRMLHRRGPVVDAAVADFRRPLQGRAGARRLLWLARWGEPREVLARTDALLPALDVSTLVLHGRRDRTVPASFAERAAAAVRGARLQFLDGGHFLPLDAPEAVGGELASFLDGRPAS